METISDRRKRKEEGRRRKREKIAESGGKRPRQPAQQDGGKSQAKPNTPQSRHSKPASRQHHFGRVMESVPCRNKPRTTTLSIALPGSVMSNCQTKELRTQLAGQIARAATIYHVDEIVVFDDKLSRDLKSHHFGSFRKRHRDGHHQGESSTGENEPQHQQQERRPPFDPHGFMAKILQYCECPQYLRRHFFPMHPDLQFAGLLAPIDAPHHVRAEDRSKYREGVVLDKVGLNKGSLVNCGIRSRPIEIDATLQPGVRCTVQLEPSAYDSKGAARGKVVSPSAPREDDGTYWGYTVRMADSLKGALEECPYEGGYDLKIGTSERGTSNLDDLSFEFPTNQHALIVFGGVAGIEECVDADETVKLPGSESRKLFDMWVNICKYQGSRTIRTEEAVLITLAKACPLLAITESKHDETRVAKGDVESNNEGSHDISKTVAFSDAPSEESSENEDEDSE